MYTLGSSYLLNMLAYCHLRAFALAIPFAWGILVSQFTSGFYFTVTFSNIPHLSTPVPLHLPFSNYLVHDLLALNTRVILAGIFVCLIHYYIPRTYYCAWHKLVFIRWMTVIHWIGKLVICHFSLDTICLFVNNPEPNMCCIKGYRYEEWTSASPWRGPQTCCKRYRVSLCLGISSEFCWPVLLLHLQVGPLLQSRPSTAKTPVPFPGHLKSISRLFCLVPWGCSVHTAKVVYWGKLESGSIFSGSWSPQVEEPNLAYSLNLPNWVSLHN